MQLNNIYVINMTMEWAIEFFRDSRGKEPVKEFLLSLTLEGRAKTLRLFELLKSQGVLLKEPYTRQVKDKIRELRTTDKSGEVRILYFAYTGETFVLLHGFLKKTQKTPVIEIGVAEKRLNEFLEKRGEKK